MIYFICINGHRQGLKGWIGKLEVGFGAKR
jgi:hypothetical protein